MSRGREKRSKGEKIRGKLRRRKERRRDFMR